MILAPLISTRGGIRYCQKPRKMVQRILRVNLYASQLPIKLNNFDENVTLWFELCGLDATNWGITLQFILSMFIQAGSMQTTDHCGVSCRYAIRAHYDTTLKVTGISRYELPYKCLLPAEGPDLNTAPLPFNWSSAHRLGFPKHSKLTQIQYHLGPSKTLAHES